MKKRLFCLAFTILLILSMIPAMVSAAGDDPITVIVNGSTQFNREVHFSNLLSIQLEESGLTPLEENGILQQLARERAAEIALYYDPDHIRPDGSANTTILEGNYDGWTIFSELIAIGPATGADALAHWMNDPQASADLKSGDFTDIGIGCFETGGTYIWVALLGDSSYGRASRDSGDENAWYFISVLPSNFHPDMVDEYDITLGMSQGVKIYASASNPGYEGLHASLLVLGYSFPGSELCSVYVPTDGNGTAEIIADPIPGECTVELVISEELDIRYRVNVTIVEDAEAAAPLPDHEHTPVLRDAKPAVCDIGGYTGDTYCSECHFLLSAGTYTDALDHSCTDLTLMRYPDWETRDEGKKWTYCTGCGACWDYSVFYVEDPHENGHPVTVHAPEGTDYTLSISQAYSGHEVFIQVNDSRGYFFEGASITAENGESIELTVDGQYIWFTMPDCPVNVELNYTERTSYEIIEIAGEGGYVRGNPNPAYEGEEVEVWVSAYEGYRVSDVTFTFHGTYEPEVDYIGVDELGGFYTFNMPDGDVTVSATFEPLPGYSIMVLTTTEGGTAELSTETAREGETFTLMLYPDDGYRVDQIRTYSMGTYKAEGYQIGNNEFLITMPDGDVLIEVSFVITENPFNDIKSSDYFYEPVLWAVSNNITSGIGNGRFAPANPCTRAQVVTFLWRAAGEPEPTSGRNPFTDVKKSDYYYKAVLWAVENGITSGMSANKFGPNNPCTRAQVVTFLWRAAGESDPIYGYNPFRDVSTNDYYYNAVLWAVEYGITAGINDTQFGPSQTCTRGQVVTFLYRFLHG